MVRARIMARVRRRVAIKIRINIFCLFEDCNLGLGLQFRAKGLRFRAKGFRLRAIGSALIGNVASANISNRGYHCASINSYYG